MTRKAMEYQLFGLTCFYGTRLLFAASGHGGFGAAANMATVLDHSFSPAQRPLHAVAQKVISYQ